MKKLITLALTVALISVSANAAPSLDYRVREVDPVTGESGVGLFLYTFIMNGNDGLHASFATTNLTFSGDIRQLGAPAPDLWDATHPVDYETTALAWNGRPNLEPGGVTYNCNLDSWLYGPKPSLDVQDGVQDGWSFCPFGLNLYGGMTPGVPMILSVCTGVHHMYQSKELVQIVATGDVQVEGLIHRRDGDFEISYTATPEPATMGLMLFGAIGMIARKRRGCQSSAPYSGSQSHV
jgi:hypothetical protein